MFAKARGQIVLIELIIERGKNSFFEFLVTVKGNDVLLIKQLAIYLKEKIKIKIRKIMKI